MGLGQAFLSGQTGIQAETYEAYRALTERELNEVIANKPGDARLHVFAASYYRAVGDLEKATEELATARELSPQKQAIILQQGAVELARGDNARSRDYFKKAYELDVTNPEAKEFYIGALYLAGDTETAKTLIAESDEVIKERLAQNDFVVGAANQVGDFATLAALYEIRASIASTMPQNWASLAFTYYQLDEIEKAIDALERGSVAAPGFAPTAQCVTDNLRAGRTPDEGC